MRLGIALAWHTLCWEELLEITRIAAERGYEVLYHDGDVTMLGSDSQRDVLHGWTVSNALIARSERIHIASIRLVQHWNAPHLAQAIATAEDGASVTRLIRAIAIRTGVRSAR